MASEQNSETVNAAPSGLPDGIGDWQKAAMIAFKPLVSFLWRIDVEGLENLPDHGGAVLCPNHLAAIDSFILPSVLPRSITYVGKAEYLDDWKTRTIFPKLGMIPIDRRGGKHSSAALDAAREVLLSGRLFGIYPEGTRSRSGMLHRGHTGAARLAVETGTPIIPVGLLGTPEIQPPGQSVPNVFRRAKVKIGKPIDSLRYRSRVGDRAIYRELIDEVMYEIGQLTGQAYSETYAGAKAGNSSKVTSPKRANDEPTIERRSSAEALSARPLLNLG